MVYILAGICVCIMTVGLCMIATGVWMYFDFKKEEKRYGKHDAA